jgi:hypothetical protein
LRSNYRRYLSKVEGLNEENMKFAASEGKIFVNFLLQKRYFFVERVRCRLANLNAIHWGLIAHFMVQIKNLQISHKHEHGLQRPYRP